MLKISAKKDYIKFSTYSERIAIISAKFFICIASISIFLARDIKPQLISLNSADDFHSDFKLILSIYKGNDAPPFPILFGFYTKRLILLPPMLYGRYSEALTTLKPRSSTELSNA